MVLLMAVARPSFAQSSENPRPGAWHENSNNVEKRAQMGPTDDKKLLVHVDITIEGRQSQSEPSRGEHGSSAPSGGVPSAQTSIGLDGGLGSRSNQWNDNQPSPRLPAAPGASIAEQTTSTGTTPQPRQPVPSLPARTPRGAIVLVPLLASRVDAETPPAPPVLATPWVAVEPVPQVDPFAVAVRGEGDLPAPQIALRA